MALNQILNAVDEAIDGSPRYNITDNGDGTKSIELANEIVQEGTAINRNTFNKISNVLSYLTPSVEKTSSQIVISGTTNPLPTTWTESGSNYNTCYGTSTISHFGRINIVSTVPTSSGYRTSYAVDGNNGSYYVANATATQFYRFQFEKAIQINSIRLIVGDYGINPLPIIIQGSNDGTNYDDLWNGNIANNSTTNAVLTNDNEYLYYRIYRNSTSTSVYDRLGIQDIYITSWQYIETQYQNQFTLDNNGTFTNNQRVLVETPTNIQEIEKTITQDILPTDITQTWNYTTSSGGNINSNIINGNLTSFNGLTPTYEYKTTSSNGFYANNSSAITNTTIVNSKNSSPIDLSNTRFLSNAQLKTSLANNYNEFVISKPENATLFYNIDMKIECRPTFIYLFSLIQNTTANVLEASSDNINWESIKTLDTTAIEFTPQNYYRYYRLRFENTLNKDAYITFKYFYISSITYKETTEIPYDVISNTINNVPCDTLLNPSTKYELIYNESDNKFEIGGNLTLFDITLTEDVNQVDLTGISDMLKEGKMYLMNIKGSCTEGHYDYMLGSSAVGHISYSGLEYYSTLIYPYVDNGIKKIRAVNYYSTSYFGTSSILTGYEYLKMNSKAFTAGTRIVIKEIA